MEKGKMNIILDQELITFAKAYAKEPGTRVSEIIGPFILNLKRTQGKNDIETILSDRDFRKALLETVSQIRSGKMTWHAYDEVFDGSLQ